MDSYSQLFSVDIQHTFYNNSICGDFYIEPTPTCESLLKGHRLVLKNTLTGINVIAPADTNNDFFISLSDGLVFTFLLKLKNTDFGSFTDLSNINNGNVYLFHNQDLTEGGELTQSEVALDSVERVDYSLVFGVIEITNNSSLPSNLDSASAFTLSFSPKQEIWKYYLVVQNNNYDWSIVDADEDVPVSFSETDLNTDDPADDNVAQAIKSQYPDSQRFLFESDQSISYSWVGRKNLQLKKDLDVVVDNLPNPSFHDNGVKIIKII